jgi:hypothetical protein
MFIIKDWCGNILNYKGRFDSPSFAVAIEFESFDEGWDYLYQMFPDGDQDRTFDDLFVVKKEEK